jgi:ParB-like chromosome segregation protein Spo0J
MKYKNKLQELLEIIDSMDLENKIDAINNIKLELHKISPFKNEPVDCVLWAKGENVFANDYNPNKVAPPEMELLKTSIENDGYTQPIVTYNEDGKIVVIDGFHRNIVGKECITVRDKIFGYLPITIVRESQKNRNDRIASTIRHNRARGSHNVELMSTIVSELVEMGKGDHWICQHIGMSKDELLRMKQITGLASLFKNTDFSESWEADVDALKQRDKDLNDLTEDEIL